MTFDIDAAVAAGGPEWLRARRGPAFERFRSAGLPSPAEETWRYSRIAELDLEAYAPLTGGPGAEPAGLPDALAPLVAGAGARAGLVVVRNGRVVAAEVDPALAAKGVVVGAAADLPDGDDVLGAVAAAYARDAFTDLNAAFTPGGVVVRVPAGVVVEAPFVVAQWVDADGAAVFPRLSVQAGEAAQLTVVDWSTSADVAALVAPVVELDVGPGANVRHLGVQALGRRVWQLGHAASRVGRDATLESTTVALGGDYARVRTDAGLPGRGASSALLAVYFGAGAQMHDFRTLQDHTAPKTTSDLLFKGAVSDTSHSVYTGLIRVKKGAAGTNAFQTNRNLVLSQGASADSVPNLEIEENDLRCSHASAVGPIDEAHRYYLESRGVPPEVADRLIVLGFFDDVLARTPVPALREPLRRALAAKLDRTEVTV